MARLFLWAPVVAYMAVIFWLSSMPHPPDPPGALSSLSDKSLHSLVYGGLALLIGRALAGGWLRPATFGTCLLAALLTTGYGVTDEVHQHFVPPRQMEALDLAADAAGALIAALALYLVTRYSNAKGRIGFRAK